MARRPVGGLLLSAVLERPPSVAGRCRVVTVDGPAGSGKTTAADACAAAARDAGHHVEVVRMDDLYDGWRGVLTVHRQVADILGSLAESGVARHRCYDWSAGSYAGTRRLGLPDLLVLEGVGSSHATYDASVTLRVWVEAPRAVRLRRGLARDGEHLRAQWLQFLDDEADLHARDRTRERADLVVDGLTGEVSRPAPSPPGPR